MDRLLKRIVSEACLIFSENYSILFTYMTGLSSCLAAGKLTCSVEDVCVSSAALGWSVCLS